MQLTDITDLSRAMFNVIQRDTLTNLLMPNQKYLAMSQIFREARRGFAGLTGQFDLLTDDNGAARSVGLEDEDVFREKDGVQFGTFTMRHTETSWLYHRYAVLSNRDDKAKIYEYLKVKRVQALASLHKFNESVFWGKPDSNTSTKDPFGILYSLCWNATPSTLSQFTGANPGGTVALTNVYGIDTSVTTANIDRYRNYSGTYTNVQSNDFLDLYWDAREAINFETPVDLDEFKGETGKTFRCYTDYTTFKAIKHMMEGRNQNLGWDLASVGNMILADGNAIQWVPAWSSNKDMARPINSASHPFALVNWNSFGIRFLEGNYMEETGPYKRPNYHNQIANHLDLSWQSVNQNRRANAILAIADPLA